jgi:signal transduction histidine kinase/ActR/RegA family two-component response regulator
VRPVRLRTKFLLSLLAITAGLTAATLFVVSYTVQQKIRENLQLDLRGSVNTYRSFEQQRQATMTQASGLLANLPTVRALMTTRDPATIQDASADVWRLSGNDLLAMADRSGNLVALKTNATSFARSTAQALLRHSLDKGDSRDWWFGGGHLFEVWIQPIYFGPPSENSTIGFLAVADDIDSNSARNFSTIVSGDVAFFSDDVLVAANLRPDQQNDLLLGHRPLSRSPAVPSQEIQLGKERFLMTSVILSSDPQPLVSLSILKSLDSATFFLNHLHRILLALGLVSVLAGSSLVFVISDTFTRPLANLVGGVRALERGEFDYPLGSSSGDEVAEVTSAFDRMRASLQKSQENHKQLEDRLRQAHKMEAVGRLAGGVAHDFNNLLTIIRGHCDLLLDRATGNNSQRLSIEQIRKAGERAVSMTRQLLAFSRKQVLQPRVLDLNAVVAEMGKMLPRLIGEHIEYVFQPEPQLAHVKADPGQIEQVIMNLVVNSRDAMPDGGKITVCTKNVLMDEAEARNYSPMTVGAYVLLSVTDTGHGMSAETKAHIFEPFFTTKEIGKGTGLGLATVYGVVKQSGGFIWVDSAPGKGATFLIYLPPVSSATISPTVESSQPAIPRGTETILVVEDEPNVRELACEFLKSSGYSVLEAHDGLEALEILSRHTGVIHLVLTDMVMPKMSGVELISRARAARLVTKVVLMSGYSEYSSTSQSQFSQEMLILQKPFSRLSLIEKVREALTAPSIEQAAPRSS